MTGNQVRFFFQVALLLTGYTSCCEHPGFAQAVTKGTPPGQLNVALFAFLPDASAAIERLERDAEKYTHDQGHDIDFDFELWDPYSDAVDDNGLGRISEFDLVEIDCCRLKELIEGGFGGLDPLTSASVQNPATYVGPAKTMLARTTDYG